MRQKITQIKQCAACETLNSFFSRNNSHWGLRIGLLLFIAGLQFGQFYLKFELYEIIPYNGYVNVEMSFDDYIPYLEWSWVIYYFGFAYIAIWGAAGIWRFSKRELYRTVTVYSLLIFMGLVLHLAIPTQAPWPLIENMANVQNTFKEIYGVKPLACLPSMHVALTVLPAFISLFVFKSSWYRLLSIVLAILVSASTVTAKEHWFLDVVSGLLLGLLACWIWVIYVLKQEANKPPNKSKSYTNSLTPH